jgi:hypothetical protein
MELRTPEKYLAQRAKNFSCSPLSNRVIPLNQMIEGDIFDATIVLAYFRTMHRAKVRFLLLEQ